MLDSGASFHVTSDSSSLVSCKPVTDGACVQTADGTSCPITHKGSLCNTHFAVPNVSYVPQLSMNLLSVGQVTDQNCFVGFDDSSCFIQDRRSGQVIGTGHRRKGASSLYVLDTLHLPSSVGSPASVSSAALSSASSFAKWHHRLGHLCGSRLSSLINQGCLGPTSIESSFHCKGCKLGKQIQLPQGATPGARPRGQQHVAAPPGRQLGLQGPPAAVTAMAMGAGTETGTVSGVDGAAVAAVTVAVPAPPMGVAPAPDAVPGSPSTAGTSAPLHGTVVSTLATTLVVARASPLGPPPPGPSGGWGGRGGRRRRRRIRRGESNGVPACGEQWLWC